MFKSLLKSAISRSGLTNLFRPFYAGCGTILCFHHIYPDSYTPPDAKRLSTSRLTPDCLGAIVDHYRSLGYRFVSLDDIPDELSSPHRRSPFVAVTFDDGYSDTLAFAYPVLSERKIPFTVYVSSGPPEENIMLWFYQLDRMIYESDEVRFVSSGNETVIDCITMTAKRAAFSRLLVHCLSADDQRGELTSLLTPDYRTVAHLDSLLMTPDETRTLDSDPLVTIGAHTVSHPNLASLPTDEARKQMILSRQSLEKALGHSVNHFAYPYGGQGFAGNREFKIASAASFSTAVTTRNSHCFPVHRGHLMSLPRILIGPMVCRSPHLLSLYSSGFISAVQNRGKRYIVV